MINAYIVVAIIAIQSAAHIFIAHIHAKRFSSVINRQQDTIQRLINREPVTYAETGQKPQKPVKEVYAAWGAQMVNLDVDSVESK